MMTFGGPVAVPMLTPAEELRIQRSKRALPSPRELWPNIDRFALPLPLRKSSAPICDDLALDGSSAFVRVLRENAELTERATRASIAAAEAQQIAAILKEQIERKIGTAVAMVIQDAIAGRISPADLKRLAAAIERGQRVAPESDARVNAIVALGLQSLGLQSKPPDGPGFV